MKFGRNYRLTVQIDDETSVVIQPPMTVQFNIVRSTNASINTGSFQIYNLSESRRQDIFQDRFDTSNQKKVTFEAGYGKLTTVFKGYIFQADSSRVGSDIITTIQARDGFNDIRNDQISATYPAGLTVKQVVENLTGGFSAITKGTISEFDDTFPRPVAVDGNVFELINKYTGDKAYVDLNELNAVKNEDVINAAVVSFDSKTGLLETPKREGAFLSIKTLFQPDVQMSQLVDVNSSILKQYKGQYKVIGVQHQGVISEAVGGQCSSSFNLLLGGQLYGAYNQL